MCRMRVSAVVQFSVSFNDDIITKIDRNDRSYWLY